MSILHLSLAYFARFVGITLLQVQQSQMTPHELAAYVNKG